MDKVRIVYATMTKHSKRLADAIAESFGCTAENVDDNPVIQETGVLFLVGGIYAGQSKPEFLDYLEDMNPEGIGKTVLITSCASKKKGQDMVRAVLRKKKIAVAGEYICKGNFLIMAIGHPNKKDVRGAVEYARRMAGEGQRLS